MVNALPTGGRNTLAHQQELEEPRGQRAPPPPGGMPCASPGPSLGLDLPSANYSLTQGTGLRPQTPQVRRPNLASLLEAPGTTCLPEPWEQLCSKGPPKSRGTDTITWGTALPSGPVRT